jgi:hypothetical protein
MGTARGTHGSEPECTYDFREKTRWKITNRETDAGGMIILKWI